jgi:16S rRNA (guanine1516-N2)-methyltransferase
MQPTSPLPLALLAIQQPTADVLALATSLNIPLVDDSQAAILLLRYQDEQLELCKPADVSLPGTLRVDFACATARRRRRHPSQELLVQAAKVRHIVQPLLIDATAGLGRDGFLLAAAGFRVQMLECNPVVAALLADGLQRAGGINELTAITARIQLMQQNALDYLPRLIEQPAVIYLDPMFPARNKSALVKQELRFLQLLDQRIDHANTTPEQLLQAALAVGARKVVVKRPRKGPCLMGLQPAYALTGKAIRFDVYL